MTDGIFVIRLEFEIKDTIKHRYLHFKLKRHEIDDLDFSLPFNSQFIETEYDILLADKLYNIEDARYYARTYLRSFDCVGRVANGIKIIAQIIKLGGVTNALKIVSTCEDPYGDFDEAPYL